MTWPSGWIFQRDVRTNRSQSANGPSDGLTDSSWDGPFNFSAGHAGHNFKECGLEPIQVGSSEDDQIDSSGARPANRCTKRAWHQTGPRGPSLKL